MDSDNKEITSEAYKDDPQVQRIFKYLPAFGYSDLVILKGHLLAEEVLNEIIIAHFYRGELDKLRLSFSQKVLLAQSLCAASPELAWTLCSALNGIRNEYAHKLESPQADSKIENFLNLCRSDNEMLRRFSDCPTPELLRLAIAGLLGLLHRVRETAVVYGDAVKGYFARPRSDGS